MPGWVVRPGRGLALLEVVAMWPLWSLAVGLAPPMISLGLTAVLVCLPLLVAAHVSNCAPEVSGTAQRSPGIWCAALWLAPAAMLLGTRVGPIDAWILAIGVCAALIASAWHLELARRARRWVSGRLRITDQGARIIAPEAIYVLAVPPPGAVEGDWITIPRIESCSRGEGPYRTGRPSARASDLIIAPGDVLARQLALRGALLFAWAVQSLVWLAL